MDTKEECYEFDDLLIKEVGTFGRRQKFLSILLVLSNGCLALHSLGPVFIAAIPDHWCAVNDGDFQNCTKDEIKTVTIPKEKKDGKLVYSSCSVYSYNVTDFDPSMYCGADQSGSNQNVSEFRGKKGCESWQYSTEYFSKTIVNEVGRYLYFLS